MATPMTMMMMTTMTTMTMKIKMMRGRINLVLLLLLNRDLRGLPVARSPLLSRDAGEEQRLVVINGTRGHQPGEINL